MDPITLDMLTTQLEKWPDPWIGIAGNAQYCPVALLLASEVGSPLDIEVEATEIKIEGDRYDVSNGVSVLIRSVDREHEDGQAVATSWVREKVASLKESYYFDPYSDIRSVYT